MTTTCTMNHTRISKGNYFTRFRPPRIAMLYLGLMMSVYYITLLLFGNEIAINMYALITGGCILVAGFSVMIWAWVLFQKARTPICPNELATSLIVSGPYKISRNPMYLGMAAILLGISVCFGSVTIFMSPVLFCLTIHFAFLPLEEQNMESLFGDQYRTYKRRVRAWI